MSFDWDAFNRFWRGPLEIRLASPPTRADWQRQWERENTQKAGTTAAPAAEHTEGGDASLGLEGVHTEEAP